MAITKDFKLVYFGALWKGSTARLRSIAFAALPGVSCIPVSIEEPHEGGLRRLVSRVRWKLGYPRDTAHENRHLLEVVAREKPDGILVDSSRVITRRTLRKIRAQGPIVRAFYSPDDTVGRHFMSVQLRRSLPAWDVFLTNKIVNVGELRALGATNPVLVGKGCDPAFHRPLTPAEVGVEWEAFDLVFVGMYEAERCQSINRLAEAGMRVVVYGNGWRAEHVDARITLRPAQFAEAYIKALHTGKVALGFLRKLNRDTITSRTWETTAAGRPFLAEKTADHDAAFADGTEYVGFRDDDELVAKARALLDDEPRRREISRRGRERCLASGATTTERAGEMLGHISAAREKALSDWKR